MVSDENATMIVTTCRLREGSTKKCEKFWPDLGKDFEFDGKIQVKAVEVETITKHLERRVFHLSDPEVHQNLPIV